MGIIITYRCVIEIYNWHICIHTSRSTNKIIHEHILYILKLKDITDMPLLKIPLLRVFQFPHSKSKTEKQNL
jgi:hypothetical protein